MTLRTIAIANPAPGADWSYSIPGKYLLDITGITGTLDSGSGLDVMTDSSGNGNDGTYLFNGGYPVSVAGLLSGANAVLWNQPNAVVQGGSAIASYGGMNWLAPWTVAWWYAWDAEALHDEVVFAVAGTFSPQEVSCQIAEGGSVILNVAGDVGGAFASYLVDPSLTDGSRHFLAVTFDGTDLALYLDGVMQTPFSSGSMTPATWTPTTMILSRAIGGDPSENSIYQCFAMVANALTAPQIATLYLAGLASAATYNAAMLGLAPETYYEMNDPIGGPRQVVLRIARDVLDLEQIPTGFPLASGGGPFRYSWQPGLPASTQLEDGSLTTVAIPRLLLPAGYVIASHTLDIGSSDQWSDVTIWWDDAAMLGATPIDPWRFPPAIYPVFTNP